MSALARYREEHRERRARWAALAYNDNGIDLKRPRPDATVIVMPWARPKPVPPLSKAGRFRRVVLRPTVPSIAREVGHRYGVRWKLLVGHCRKQSRVRVRFIAIYITWRIVQSLPHGGDRFSKNNFGARFGGRDHSTIWHAIRTVEKRMAADFFYAAKVAAVECSIRRQLEVGTPLPECGLTEDKHHA